MMYSVYLRATFTTMLLFTMVDIADGKQSELKFSSTGEVTADYENTKPNWGVIEFVIDEGVADQIDPEELHHLLESRRILAPGMWVMSGSISHHDDNRLRAVYFNWEPRGVQHLDTEIRLDWKASSDQIRLYNQHINTVKIHAADDAQEFAVRDLYGSYRIDTNVDQLTYAIYNEAGEVVKNGRADKSLNLQLTEGNYVAEMRGIYYIPRYYDLSIVAGEEQSGFQEFSYHFDPRVQPEPTEEKDESNFLADNKYWLLAGVLVSGSTAAVLLQSGDEGTISLPTPPARPD